MAIKTLLFLLLLGLYQAGMFLAVWEVLPTEYSSRSYFGREGADQDRMILVGSSNLSFNYDYQAIDAHFNQYDVVGCNMEEPNGLFATIRKLKQLNLSKNDLVVLCLPHSHYEKDKFLPVKVRSKQGFSKALIKEAFTQFPYLSSRAFLAISPLELPDARYQHFLPEADSTAFFLPIPVNHTDPTYQSCWTNKEDKFQIQSLGFDRGHLKTIQKWLLQDLGCKVLFRFPALRDGQYNIQQERIAYLNEHFPFINKFENSVYDHNLWYNQWYHLNLCGKERSTALFLQEMDAMLENTDLAQSLKQ